MINDIDHHMTFIFYILRKNSPCGALRGRMPPGPSPPARFRSAALMCPENLTIVCAHARPFLWIKSTSSAHPSDRKKNILLAEKFYRVTTPGRLAFTLA